MARVTVSDCLEHVDNRFELVLLASRRARQLMEGAETTLDVEARSLLQVRVNHVDEAEEVFSTLMGDVVEPRREFIQANALKVANLDV